MKLLLMLFIFLIPFKQTTKVVVVDKKTEEALIGAKLTVNGKIHYTDFDGVSEIDYYENDTIIVEYPSYHTLVKKIDGITTIELITK